MTSRPSRRRSPLEADARYMIELTCKMCGLRMKVIQRNAKDPLEGIMQHCAYCDGVDWMIALPDEEN